MFLKIIHFAYWRRIWLANYFRAAMRYIGNYSAWANRVAWNYTLLYLRFMKLNATGLIRALKPSRNRPLKVPPDTNGSYVPNLPKSSDSVADLNQWGRKDLLRFIKQRFTYRNVGDLEKRWIHLSTNDLTNDSAHRVVSANLVVHVHYLDIAIEMINYLIHSKVAFNKVVITCTDDDLRPSLERAAKNLAQNGLEVITVENSYRDARPFLIALHRLGNNLPILKIHTKKSPHLSERDGIAWRQSLLEGLVPNSINVERFTTLLKSESVPLVICPKEWLAESKHWGRNDLYVYSICLTLGIEMIRNAPFPMGTMFWANKELLDELKKLPIPGSQNVREAHWSDSTWAHGFERAIGQIIANTGKGISLD